MTTTLGTLRIEDTAAFAMIAARRTVWWYVGDDAYHTSGRTQPPSSQVCIGTLSDAIDAGCTRRCEVGDCRRRGSIEARDA